MTVLVPHVALLGLGLIGSSLARALRRRGVCQRLSAMTLEADALDHAVAAGVVDSISRDPAAAVEGADIVIFAVPMGAYRQVALAIAPALRPGAIVTDVGSVKQPALEVLRQVLPAGTAIVPGHPIAGTENSGWRSGFAELFQERWAILTPADEADAAAVETIRRLWLAIGSKVDLMDAEHHDRVLAITSHLPHLIAYTIVGTATDLEDHLKTEVIKYSASGFRDFTRIAASDPIMWRDVFLTNRTAVLEILQRFTEDLTALQRAIRWGEGERLELLFSRTRDIRRALLTIDPVVRRAPDPGPADGA